MAKSEVKGSYPAMTHSLMYPFHNCYQIKQRLLEKYNKRWKKIAMKNAEMMFCENEPYIMDIMKR